MPIERRTQNWADLEEDDVPDHFETKTETNGVKTVTEYVDRDGKLFRVTKKVCHRKVWRRIRLAAEERKQWEGFGKCGKAEDEGNTVDCKPKPTLENIHIEVPQKAGGCSAALEDPDEQFYNESLDIVERLFQKKKAFTVIVGQKQEEREQVGRAQETLDLVRQRGGDLTQAPGRYVPPMFRKEAQRCGGIAGDDQQDVRVSHLSETVRDGDLHALFGQFGSLRRVFLPKDPIDGSSRGFAFLSFYRREDAARAIEKLNGHGYDNLIMKVEWAKKRA